ncbi:MAG TPA: methyltransferase domain-containing protein [Solirubrobacterales bacterium]|jgi:ubiquinone/menaquinone biosynthesis C-methylase UbiE|nr:methyltransferase domain-containing protein [Solirubrobacterales bacterium]
MTLSTEEIKEANIVYHDAAADEYDAKWGIDYGPIGRSQVELKTQKVLGKNPGTFARGLEIGTGTGYFSLNMMQNGLLDQVVCTDISEGMLRVVERSAEKLGFGDRVTTLHTEAERFPFEDESFDIVFGHAVLHHLPDLQASFNEFLRVLKPGGKIFFAGEPSANGDRLARYPKTAGHRLSPLWRKALRVREGEPHAAPADGEFDGHSVEHLVDVHAFKPEDISKFVKTAGFDDIRVIGEELTANWFGWFNRALEANADVMTIPNAWRQYAYRGYLGFQWFDRAALEGRLPASIFYNLMVGATKPSR